MLHKSNIPSVRELLAEEPNRASRFSICQNDWLLDYCRLPLTSLQNDALLAMPGKFSLSDAIQRLFGGHIVNPSEQQPALHMALRAARPDQFPGADPDCSLLSDQNRFLALADELYQGSRGLTDLIHIGIGGSDLGPRLVVDALDDDSSALQVHWLSTLDSRRCRRLLARLDPATTGVVIASKSFSTEETLTQAMAVRDWLGDRFAQQAWAATARADRASEFGVSPSAILPFPAWTGGRYSLWSSVGTSAAASLGSQRFRELLAGAAEADRQFALHAGRQPVDSGLAVGIALVMHALRRELDLPTLGVIAYEPRLALLGDYLQQLVMESLGKGVDLDDRPLDQPTSPLVFGGRGTDLQHSIFQALHQGPDTHPLLLVGTLSDAQADPAWHKTQLAHMLAQAAAMVLGRDDERPCRQLPGNRPVALLIGRELTARSLGFLLASFEHAVFALSVYWQINPFDQWGVEEGKRLAAEYQKKLAEESPILEDFPAAGFFCKDSGSGAV